MKRTILLLFLLICTTSIAQKVKGSRNVSIRETQLDNFTALEIKGDFEVEIRKGNQALMEIEADDNLHSVIKAHIINETLYLRPVKRIRRSKAQKIRLTFPDELRKISISENVILESPQKLYLQDFELHTSGKSKTYLTLTAATFRLTHNEKAKIELNLTADNVSFQLNESSKIEALVNSSVLKVDTYEKARARIDGDIEEFELRAEHSSRFDGSNLIAVNAKVVAEGRSENKINVAQNLELQAKNRSQVEIYNSPKIELLKFSEKAVLLKRD